jgi:hypothetical protein
LLDVQHNLIIEAALGVAKHAHAFANDVLQPSLADSKFPVDFYRLQSGEYIVRRAVPANFETLRRQRPQMFRIERSAPVIANDRDVESPGQASRAQKLSHLKIAGISVVPTRGHNA